MASTDIPTSYETLNLTHVKIYHDPPGAPVATPVVVLTLHRPERNNAFTPQMADSLAQAYQMFHLDPRVRVVVLTGTGRLFCAGSDLTIGFGDGKGPAVDFRDIGGRVALAMHRCHKPTIAALQGSAVGVGMTMTLPAAIRHVFDLHWRHVPSTPQYFGGLFMETISDAAQVLPRALDLAHEMATNVSPLASSMSRALMWEGPASPEAAHLLESRVFHHMIGQRDYKEGVNSFLEKRQPEFQTDPRQDSSPNYPWWSTVDTALDPSKGSKL
ncbi:Enoyl-CoA hydratase AKT3-1 [Penicillium chermesinum]|uniref:Enoyl-CoA hydratase AKT3-1 n=1 Tax=Penicillium chermesinum TaxID=63820 RepID=A0A9W9TKY0_9EURO|nr:Enoyl-CoA hydratase AKT3-1 [Penicillium chermesinum]KAJ5226503.1 Enoyl-CoA hydratase AKT3-1 [Penicillium chermesinum]